MQKRISTIVLLFLSVLLTALIIPIGAFSFQLKCVAAILIFFLLTIFAFKRSSEKNTWLVLSIISLPPLLFYFTVHIVSGEDALVALPSSFAHAIGIGMGYVWVRIKRKFLVSVICFLFVVGYSFYVNEVWGDWVQYRNVSHSVFDADAKRLFENERSENITDSVFTHRIVVLDFWNTGCAACFREFPELEKLYDKWSSDSDVKIYSVNVPLNRDTSGQALKMINDNNYHFPVLFCSNENFFETFGLNSFPSTLIIIDRQEIETCADIQDLDARISELLLSGK